MNKSIPYSYYECSLALEELYRGDKVVIPSSVEHTEFMIKIAQDYIEKHKQEMLEILRK